MDKNNKNLEKVIKKEAIILDDNTDLLGNRIYSEYLYNVIENSLNDDQVETIALYGEWGSGKSSIIKTVENKFKLNNNKVDNNKTTFEIYNAWKYSSDDFKKSFIIDLDENYEKEINAVRTSKEYELNKNNILGFLISLVLIVLIGIIEFCILKDEKINMITEKIIASAFVGSIMTLVIKSIFDEISTTSQIIFSSQEFSKMFGEIIKDKTKNNENYIFVIDDLDRCSYKKMLDILDCVNGFLKVKNNFSSNYLFLIPVDKDRLKEALVNLRNYTNDEQERYLDKMFDVTININSPGSINLFNMIQLKINELEMDLKSNCISLLANYLIRTPRDVNLFIEKLLMDKEIIKKRIELNYLNDDISNLEITKYFILKNKWPILYNALLQKSDVTKLDSFLDNIEKNEIYKRINHKDELTQFIRVSRYISMNKLFLYHYLKANDIYFDKNLSSIYLSCDFDKIEDSYEDETLIKTFLQTYFDKNQNGELKTVQMEFLFKSYMYLLANLKDVSKLIDSVSIDDICMNYYLFLRSLGTLGDICGSLYECIDVYRVMLHRNDTIINKFVNVFIQKITSFSISTEIFSITLLYNKEKNILSRENFINIFYLEIQCNDSDDNYLEFIFNNLDDYKYLINIRLWIKLFEKKKYHYLLALSEYDLTDYGEQMNVILSNMNIFRILKTRTFDQVEFSEIDILNNELKIIYNILESNVANNISYIKDKIDNSAFSSIIDSFYLNYDKLDTITKNFASFIDIYDTLFPDNKYNFIFLSIKKYSSHSNSKYNDFIFNVIDNINIPDLQYEAMILAASYMNFNKAFSKYYIDCCNKKVNNNYLKLIKLMEEKNKSNYKYLHKYFGGRTTMLNKTTYETSLKPILVDLQVDVYNKIVPCLSLNDIFKNTNYMSALKNQYKDMQKTLYGKTMSLKQLLKLKSIIKNRSLVNKELKRILKTNRKIYRNDPILGEFNTEAQKNIIKTIYTDEIN